MHLGGSTENASVSALVCPDLPVSVSHRIGSMLFVPEGAFDLFVY